MTAHHRAIGLASKKINQDSAVRYPTFTKRQGALSEISLQTPPLIIQITSILNPLYFNLRAEIPRYFQDVADKYDLRKYMKFRNRISSAIHQIWDKQSDIWNTR
jgi:cation diffusion facilitator CzcD-associated flavoprotein CzcO